MRNLLYVLSLCLIPLAALALPPSGERLDSALQVGLNRDPVKKSVSLGTTIDDAIDIDLTAAQKVDSLTQMLVITNLDSADNVCYGTVAWSSTDSCATRCASAAAWSAQTDPDYTDTLNCTANSVNIGSIVPAGQSRAARYDGTRCLCIVASAASTQVQVERTIR